MLWAISKLSLSRNTSRHQTDGAKKAALCVIHFQWQELAGKGEHQVSEGPKASIVDLVAGKCQAIREGHGVLARSVSGTDPQNLSKGWKRPIKHSGTKKKENKQ